MYLTYAQYIAYGGTLTEATFNDYEFQAETVVNWHTFNRLKNCSSYPSELSRCMYTLIGIIQMQSDACTLGNSADGSSNAGIASQSNDGVSVSYNVVSARDAGIVGDERMKDIIRKALSGVTNELGQDLLYRGLYPNERYQKRTEA